MMLKPANIVFFGTSEFAIPALEALKNEGYEITAVITNPDEPVGRKKVLTPPPVKVAAERLHLKIFQPRKLGIGNWRLEIPDADFDVGVTAAYGKIIPTEIINLPRFGILNIHPSLLPKYRGPTPIQSTILNGEKETGVTIIKIDEEVDHGPVISSSKFKVQSSKITSRELSEELTKLGAELLIKILPNYLAGKIELRPQDHLQATFTKKFTRDDARINWNKTAEEIDRQIHALNPEPGTWTMWNGKILKIIIATNLSRSCQNCSIKDQIKTGMVCGSGEGVCIQCCSGCLKILRLQLEGKNAALAEDFARGNHDFIGAVLE